MTIQPYLASGPIIQMHVFAAVLAIVLGPIALARRSRDRWHRRAGYAWVLSMAALAASGLFIHSTRMVGPFSPIHLLSLLTLWQLWLGVREARAGRIAAHRTRMQAIYLLALMLTGAFTLFPGRLMSHILFPEAPVAGFVVVLALTGAGCAWWLHAVSRRARQTSSA